jgi:(p)ppGpp synthase/HD superfamily hydrolase
VANILSTYGVTHLPTLQAAVLHDTVEDTDTTVEEIAAEFGEEVARIVSVSRRNSLLNTRPHLKVSSVNDGISCLITCRNVPILQIWAREPGKISK